MCVTEIRENYLRALEKCLIYSSKTDIYVFQYYFEKCEKCKIMKKILLIILQDPYWTLAVHFVFKFIL